MCAKVCVCVCVLVFRCLSLTCAFLVIQFAQLSQAILRLYWTHSDEQQVGHEITWLFPPPEPVPCFGCLSRQINPVLVICEWLWHSLAKYRPTLTSLCWTTVNCEGISHTNCSWIGLLCRKTAKVQNSQLCDVIIYSHCFCPVSIYFTYIWKINEEACIAKKRVCLRLWSQFFRKNCELITSAGEFINECSSKTCKHE